MRAAMATARRVSLYGLAYVVVGAIARTLWRLRVVGSENVPLDGPLIVAANHVSNLDPPLLGVSMPRPVWYMAKKELFAMPVIGWLIPRLNAYPVDRQAGGTAALRASLRMLKEGRCVGVFPEGGRNIGGDKEVKGGAAFLAAASGAPPRPGGDRRLAEAAAVPPGHRRVRRADAAGAEPAVGRGRSGEGSRGDHATHPHARGEHPVIIKRAKTQGFCFGVAITVKKAEEAVERLGGDVTTLGHVVHNPQMVAQLEAKGLKNAANVDEVGTGTMFVRAHGLPLETFEKAKERGLTVIDATCPMVTKIHVQAEKLRNDGYKIVVVGDANHPEVKGTLSHVPGAWCIQSVADVDALPRASRVGVVVQSTWNGPGFADIVRKLSEKYYEVRAVNTICTDTKNRQSEVEVLAREVDGHGRRRRQDVGEHQTSRRVGGDERRARLPHRRTGRARARLVRRRRNRGADVGRLDAGVARRSGRGPNGCSRGQPAVASRPPSNGR